MSFWEQWPQLLQGCLPPACFCSHGEHLSLSPCHTGWVFMAAECFFLWEEGEKLRPEATPVCGLRSRGSCLHGANRC